MKYEAKEIEFFQEDLVIVLRAPGRNDAHELNSFFYDICGESEYLTRYPEECTFNDEGEIKYIANTIDSPNNMMIVCTVNSKIIGTCEFIGYSTMKCKHRAKIAMALYRDYWGKGIGSAMLNELIDVAKAQGIEQLELEMIEGNDRAFSLYKKFGFDIVAEIPDAYRLKDGSSRKAVYMRKLLSRE